MALPYGDIALTFGEEKRTSTSDFAGVPLGTRAYLPDGRVFRYSFSGEAIGAGQLTMQKAGVAALDMDLVVTTAATDSRSVTVTHASNNAKTKDFYKGGYIYINDGAGEGHLYYVQGNAATASSDTTITLRLGDDVVREALASGTSLGGLMENPYNDVEIWDVNDIDGVPLGVAPAEVADNSYFWNQTWGMAAVLSVATAPVIGKSVHASDTTDGGIEAKVNITISTQATAAQTLTGSDNSLPVVGISTLISAVATDYAMIYLTIAQ